MQYSQEEYDIEQKKFAVDSFDQIKSKLIHQEFSPNWLIWHPSSAEINLIKPSTSGDAISITSSIKRDDSLTVKGFVHDTDPFSVSGISDVRQVYTLMTEVEGYKRNSFECNSLAAVKWLRTAKLNLENLDEISDENSHYIKTKKTKNSHLLYGLCFIHVGHDGLTEAFKSLEKFQSHPDQSWNRVHFSESDPTRTRRSSTRTQPEPEDLQPEPDPNPKCI